MITDSPTAGYRLGRLVAIPTGHPNPTSKSSVATTLEGFLKTSAVDRARGDCDEWAFKFFKQKEAGLTVVGQEILVPKDGRRVTRQDWVELTRQSREFGAA